MHDDVERTCAPPLACSPPLLRSPCSLALAACGDDSIDDAGSSDTTAANAAPTTTAAPVTTVPAPFVALRWADTGGCVVMGPNCPTYTVWSDGKVEISRTGEDTPPEVTGTIPVAEVEAWLASVADLDVDALAASVGPGSCQSCVDGADNLVTVHTSSGDVTVDSTKMAFDQSNAFFAGLAAADGRRPRRRRPATRHPALTPVRGNVSR